LINSVNIEGLNAMDIDADIYMTVIIS